MGSPIPAPTSGAFRAAAAWASGLRERMADTDMPARIWQWTLLCALVIVFAARLALAGVATLVRRRWAIAAMAVAIPLGAFEYQSHHAWRVAANDPQARGSAPAGGKSNDSAEQNARFDNWKRSVEEAVKNAEGRERARQQDGGRSDEGGKAPKPTDFRPHEEPAPPIDLGIDHAIEKQQADGFAEAHAINGASETKAPNEAQPTREANAMESSANSPVIDGGDALPTNGAAGAVPRAAQEERNSHRMRAHSRARGHWRGGAYRWVFYRLVGVARAPYVWSFTR